MTTIESANGGAEIERAPAQFRGKRAGVLRNELCLEAID